MENCWKVPKSKAFYAHLCLLLYIAAQVGFVKLGTIFSTTNKAIHRSIERCYHTHKGNLGQPCFHALYVTH